MLLMKDDRGYISVYKYRHTREYSVDRAATWKDEKSLDRFLQTDSYRHIAKHVQGDIIIVEMVGERPNRQAGATVRMIPHAEVQAAAAQASTRAERRARGLRR